MIILKCDFQNIHHIKIFNFIEKKVKKAVTDSGPTEPNQEKPEVIQNLFTLMEIASSKETYDYFNEKWNDMSIRYGDMKKQLAEDIVKTLAPIRERILEYQNNQELLDKVAKMGAEKARESAAATLKEVRKIIGFKVYYSSIHITRADRPTRVCPLFLIQKSDKVSTSPPPLSRRFPSLTAPSHLSPFHIVECIAEVSSLVRKKYMDED